MKKIREILRKLFIEGNKTTTLFVKDIDREVDQALSALLDAFKEMVPKGKIEKLSFYGDGLEDRDGIGNIGEAYAFNACRRQILDRIEEARGGKNDGHHKMQQSQVCNKK